MKTRAAKKSAAWLTAALCLTGMLPMRAGAWGREGHHVVARIAAKHLTAKTKAAVILLLQADPDDREKCAQKPSLDDKLACVSVWADDARRDPQFSNTAPLHFVNIPVFAPPSQRRYDASRDCASGACVVQGIDKYRAILADKSRSDADRALALKFIVHFVGDLHQPLHTAKDHDLDAGNKENHGHVADKGDRGGNLKLVTWLGQSSSPFGCWNLHAVWDDGIIGRNQVDEFALANALDGALNPQKISALQKGTVIDWVNEAFGLAVSNAYRIPKRQTSDKVCEVPGPEKRSCDKFSAQVCGSNEAHYRYHLGDSYFKNNLPVVKSQLTSAGVRLAKVLNMIFDPAGGQ
jgi:hypothetical protein